MGVPIFDTLPWCSKSRNLERSVSDEPPPSPRTPQGPRPLDPRTREEGPRLPRPSAADRDRAALPVPDHARQARGARRRRPHRSDRDPDTIGEKEGRNDTPAVNDAPAPAKKRRRKSGTNGRLYRRPNSAFWWLAITNN